MIILESGDTLLAQADADASITVAVYGLDNDGAGGVTYRKLYEGQPAAAGTVLCTVTTGHTYLLKTINVANPSTTASHTVKFTHGANDAAHTILPTTTLMPNESGAHTDTGWAFLTATGALKGIGSPGVNGSASKAIYGDGSDGALDFVTGGATTAGATRSGTIYTATRDIFASSVIVESGITLNMAQYRLLCTGTLTNLGVISCDGGAANLTVAGVAVPRGSIAGLSGSGAGGLASSAATVVGNQPAIVGSTTVLFSPGKVFGGGGLGGTGGNSNGAAAGQLNSLALGANNPSPRDLLALTGMLFTAGNSATTGPAIVGLYGGSGGGSGGRTAGTTATTGGASGAGGGVLWIAARYIDNSLGRISANGGAGGNAGGAGDSPTGGGGGGGGGTVIMFYDTLNPGTEQAIGGAPGTGLNGAAAALTGQAGVVLKMPSV